MKTNNKPLIVFTSVIAFLALIVILAPPAASMLITRMFYQAGADEVTLGDIDINPLVGTARIHNLSIRKDGARIISLGHGYLNLRISALIKKQVEIDEITISDGFIRISEYPEGVFGLKGLSFASEAAPEEATSTPSEWTFGLHYIDLDKVALQIDALKASSTIQADQLRLNRVYTWDKEGISELQAQGRINSGQFALNTQFSPLSSLPKVTGELSLNDIELADILPWIDGALDDLAGQLNLESRIDVARKSKTEWLISLDPRLQVNNLLLTASGLANNAEQIEYSGNVEASLIIPDDETGIQPSVSAAGDIVATGILVTAPSESITLADIGSVNFQQLSFTLPTAISVSQASVLNANLLQAEADKAPVASWNAVNINNIDLNEELIHLRTIEIDAIKLGLNRLEDGTLHLPLPAQKAEAKPAGSDDSEEEATKSEDSATLAVKIDELIISKGSQILISDRSVKPAYSSSVTLDNFLVKNINSQNVDQAAMIDIGATANRYAKIKTSGTIKPFMDIPDAELKTSIAGVNLTRINPYALEHSGYQIRNGSMNLDSDLKIQNNIIDETIRLKLHNLDLEVGDKEKAANTDAKLAIGLPAALSLLKDSKDDIKLNLPVTGDLSDPNFDFSHAITVVVSKALAKGTTAYAVYALQPWGAALLVKDVAGKMVTQVNLDPIVYEAGSPEAPEDASLYLEKISELMKNRPGIELRICAPATEGDRIVMARKILEEKKYLGKDEPTLEQAREVVDDAALVNLAQERMFSVKDTLIEKHQIPQDRLQTCLPRLDTNTDAAPVVKLNI